MPIQLNMFNDKFFVDKNFSFNIINGSKGRNYNFSFQESYNEPEHLVLDAFTFLLKKTYDDPISIPEWTLKEYSKFTGRSLKKLRVLTTGKPTKNYSNDTERIFYKLLNRNLLFSQSFINGGEKTDRLQALQLLTGYERTTKENDTRVKFYRASLAKEIRHNLSAFGFLGSKNDYRLMVTDYYRNSNMRVFYYRLSDIFNNLKMGRKDNTAFNDMCYMLDYDTENPRGSKRLIEDQVKKLLKLESLKGLSFNWKSNPKGYKYVPNFYINSEINESLYNEKTLDKYKRLDTHVLTKLSEIIIFSKERPTIDINEFKELITTSQLYNIIRESYQTIFKIEPKKEQVDSFFLQYAYKDDHGNLYASGLLKHLSKDGILAINWTSLRNMKLLYIT